MSEETTFSPAVSILIHDPEEKFRIGFFNVLMMDQAVMSLNDRFEQLKNY